MERKIVYSGKIQPGISKDQNCIEIFNAINEYQIKKEMKEILFLAVMKILPAYKKNKDILFHLDAFARNGKVYPEHSSSKYIQNMIDEVMILSKEDFEYYVNKLINFVRQKNIEFKFEEWKKSLGILIWDGDDFKFLKWGTDIKIFSAI